MDSNDPPNHSGVNSGPGQSTETDQDTSQPQVTNPVTTAPTSALDIQTTGLSQVPESVLQMLVGLNGVADLSPRGFGIKEVSGTKCVVVHLGGCHTPSKHASSWAVTWGFRGSDPKGTLARSLRCSGATPGEIHSQHRAVLHAATVALEIAEIGALAKVSLVFYTTLSKIWDCFLEWGPNWAGNGFNGPKTNRRHLDYVQYLLTIMARRRTRGCEVKFCLYTDKRDEMARKWTYREAKHAPLGQVRPPGKVFNFPEFEALARHWLLTHPAMNTTTALLPGWWLPLSVSATNTMNDDRQPRGDEASSDHGIGPARQTRSITLPRTTQSPMGQRSPRTSMGGSRQGVPSWPVDLTTGGINQMPQEATQSTPQNALSTMANRWPSVNSQASGNTITQPYVVSQSMLATGMTNLGQALGPQVLTDPNGRRDLYVFNGSVPLSGTYGMDAGGDGVAGPSRFAGGNVPPALVLRLVQHLPQRDDSPLPGSEALPIIVSDEPDGEEPIDFEALFSFENYETALGPEDRSEDMTVNQVEGQNQGLSL